jgi:hypothetical protein
MCVRGTPPCRSSSFPRRPSRQSWASPPRSCGSTDERFDARAFSCVLPHRPFRRAVSSHRARGFTVVATPHETFEDNGGGGRVRRQTQPSTSRLPSSAWPGRLRFAARSRCAEHVLVRGPRSLARPGVGEVRARTAAVDRGTPQARDVRVLIPPYSARTLVPKAGGALRSGEHLIGRRRRT